MRPNREYSEALLLIASKAERKPAWRAYARYCRERERGLRKQALQSLGDLVGTAERWTFEARLSFVVWLCEHLERLDQAGLDLTPHPLTTSVLRPTLLEWATRSPDAPLPHRWLGMFFGYGYRDPHTGLVEPPDSAEQHLRRAIELDPAEQPARFRLVGILTGKLEYDAHHLPEYYIGEAEDNVEVAEEAAHLIEDITDPDDRGRLHKRLATAQQLLEDWLAFSLEPGTDFEKWCRLLGRQYAWTRHYYYRGGQLDGSD